MKGNLLGTIAGMFRSGDCGAEGEEILDDLIYYHNHKEEIKRMREEVENIRELVGGVIDDVQEMKGYSRNAHMVVRMNPRKSMKNLSKTCLDTKKDS